MQTIKRIFVGLTAFVFIAAISSCNKHTCPTYSKAESKQSEAKA